MSEILKARFGTAARSQIASTIVPGTLLLLELWLLYYAPSAPLDKASNQTDGVNNYVLALAAVVGALGATLVGVVARAFAWRVYEPKGPGTQLSPASRHWWSVRPERAPAQVSLERIEAGHGEAAVAAVRQANPHVRELFERCDAHSLREYCKFWLRGNNPSLAIDDFEVEISFTVAAILPIGLLPVVVARFLGWPWSEDAVLSALVLGAAVLVGATLAWLALRRATTRRVEEVHESVYRYFLAHWYADDLKGAVQHAGGAGR
jgi:hypothetical protein